MALVLPFVAGILAVAIAADGVGAAQRFDGCDRAFSYPIFGNVERGERPVWFTAARGLSEFTVQQTRRDNLRVSLQSFHESIGAFR
jgi:hypothetical protein